SKLTGNAVVCDAFEFFWQPPEAAYDPAQAKKLLAEAGHPNGFDGGEYYCDSSYSNLGEAVQNNLGEVGIQTKLRPIERAAFLKSWSEKKFKNIVMAGSGAFGNAATRLAAFIVKGGPYVYGSYPDIDDLFDKQAAELDHAKREALLVKIQQLVEERTVAAPIWQLSFINGVGPRVGESGFNLIRTFAYS